VLNPPDHLPLLIALALIALLGLLGTVLWPLALRDTPEDPTGEHRMTPAIAADPDRRDWAAVTAERLTATPRPPVSTPLPSVIEYDPLDPRTPLAEVERRMALAAAAPALAAARWDDLDTRVLVLR
jgi:hypothetical protein